MPKTEIKLEFVGTTGINSFVANTSSPRMVMDFNHASQALKLLAPDEPIVKTGIEYELGKYINDVRTEHDCIVKGIIPKYTEYGVEQTPVYTVFIEYEENGELYMDYIDIESYRSNHTFFGYRLKPTEEFLNLAYNAPIPKDTILATTDSHGDDGCYKYGLNANVVFMTHPAVADDGFAISESFAERGKFNSVIKRSINITKDTIPVNVNGTKDIFKFLPEIGERVREDGLLCALRPRNDWFSISDLNTTNISEPDVIFDTPCYVNPGSIVVDISVTRGNYNKPEFSSKMTEQLDRYAEWQINYYKNLISRHEQLLYEKKAIYGDVDSIKLTPRLRNLITSSTIKVNAATNPKSKLCYRKLPIDQYRIDITTVSVVKPNLGQKLADIHAAKGVVCQIIPDALMPVDELGNRADVIADSVSTIARMNLGRSYQMYLGSVSRDTQARLRQYYQTKYGDNYVSELTDADIAYGTTYLRGLYEIINPDMVTFIDGCNREELLSHIVGVATSMLAIYYPPDNANNIVDVIDNIEKSIYAPHFGRVTYTDELGNRVTTEENVRCGVFYIMFLEKIANAYSGVSSSKVNNFGFPVKGTNLDKFKYPHSITPTKTLSETEVRIIASFAPPEMIADLFDLTLNPISHKLLIRTILESKEAFGCGYDIDRNEVPYGQGKGLSILSHMFNASGFTYKHVPEEDTE